MDSNSPPQGRVEETEAGLGFFFFFSQSQGSLSSSIRGQQTLQESHRPGAGTPQVSPPALAALQFPKQPGSVGSSIHSPKGCGSKLGINPSNTIHAGAASQLGVGVKGAEWSWAEIAPKGEFLQASC